MRQPRQGRRSTSDEEFLKKRWFVSDLTSSSYFAYMLQVSRLSPGHWSRVQNSEINPEELADNSSS